MNLKSFRIRYESSQDEELIKELTQENHISFYRHYYLIMNIYQDLCSLEHIDYKYDIRKNEDRISLSSEYIYSKGRPLDIVVYQQILPHGAGTTVDKRMYWERMEDHIARKAVFTQGWVVDYNSGYISGTMSPYLQHRGFQSAEKIDGYILWQDYKIFKKKL